MSDWLSGMLFICLLFAWCREPFTAELNCCETDWFVLIVLDCFDLSWLRWFVWVGCSDLIDCLQLSDHARSQLPSPASTIILGGVVLPFTGIHFFNPNSNRFLMHAYSLCCLCFSSPLLALLPSLAFFFKETKKERHDDKTSTNDRFKTNPIVVILGYLTRLTSSINIKTFITTWQKAFKAPGFAWRVLHHPLDTTLPLTQITPKPPRLHI